MSHVRRFETLLLFLAVVLCAACGEPAAPLAPSAIDLARPWVEASPAEVRMDAAMLDRAASRAAGIPRFRALLVARSGRLVLERYFGGAEAATLLDVRSVTKGVVSALVGIAIEEGAISGVDAGIGTYLDGSYTLDDDDRRVTVRHLLAMTSGFEWRETGGPDYNAWILNGGDHVQYVLDRPLAAAPGTMWTYNSGAVHVLGMVVERASGTRLPDFAEERLFIPAGIGPVVWEPLGPDAVNGGSGIDLRGRDLLRFGQLFLQRGRSGDRQLVPDAWIDFVTAPESFVNARVGPLSSIDYGHLWWTPFGPRRSYLAWGFGGQFILVIPSLALVVVTATNWAGVSAEPGGAHGLASAVMEIILDEVVAAAR